MYRSDSSRRLGSFFQEDLQPDIGSISTLRKLEFPQAPVFKPEPNDGTGGQLDTPKKNADGSISLAIDADANQQGRELLLNMSYTKVGYIDNRKEGLLTIKATYLPTSESKLIALQVLDSLPGNNFKIYKQVIGDGHSTPFEIHFTNAENNISSKLSQFRNPKRHILKIIPEQNGKDFSYVFQLLSQKQVMPIDNYASLKLVENEWQAIKKEEYLIHGAAKKSPFKTKKQAKTTNPQQTFTKDEIYNQHFEIPITAGYYKDRYILGLTKYSDAPEGSARLSVWHQHKKGKLTWGEPMDSVGNPSKGFFVPIPKCTNLGYEIEPFPTYAVITFFDNDKEEGDETELRIYHSLQGTNEKNRIATLTVAVPKEYQQKVKGSLPNNDNLASFTFRKKQGEYEVAKEGSNSILGFRGDATRNAQKQLKAQGNQLATFDELYNSLKRQEDDFVHFHWTRNHYFNKDEQNLQFYWSYRNFVTAFELLKVFYDVSNKPTFGIDKDWLVRVRNVEILAQEYLKSYKRRRATYEAEEVQKFNKPKSDWLKQTTTPIAKFEGFIDLRLKDYIDHQRWGEVSKVVAQIKAGMLHLTKQLLQEQVQVSPHMLTSDLKALFNKENNTKKESIRKTSTKKGTTIQKGSIPKKNTPKDSNAYLKALAAANNSIQSVGMLSRKLEVFLSRYPTAKATMRRVSAIFYPEKEYLQQLNTQQIAAIPIPLIYCKDTIGKQWVIFNPMSPSSKEGFSDYVPLTNDKYPPPALFEKLNHSRSFPKGLLYYHIEGEGKKYPPIAMTGEATLGDNLKLLGGLLFFAGLFLATGGAASVIMFTGAMAGGVGAYLNQKEGERTESIGTTETVLNYMDMAGAVLAISQYKKLHDVFRVGGLLSKGATVSKIPITTAGKVATSARVAASKTTLFALRFADLANDTVMIIYGNVTAITQIIDIINKPGNWKDKLGKITTIAALTGLQNYAFWPSAGKRWQDIAGVFKNKIQAPPKAKTRKSQTRAWQNDVSTLYRKHFQESKLFHQDSIDAFFQGTHPRGVEEMLAAMKKYTPDEKAQIRALSARYSETQVLNALYYSRGDVGRLQKVMAQNGNASGFDKGKKVYDTVYNMERHRRGLPNSPSRRLKRKLDQEKSDQKKYREATKTHDQHLQDTRKTIDQTYEELHSWQHKHQNTSEVDTLHQKISEQEQAIKIYEEDGLVAQKDTISKEGLGESGQENVNQLHKSIDEITYFRKRQETFTQNNDQEALLIDMLNHAGITTLVKLLKGIGIQSAKAIVAYRKKLQRGTPPRRINTLEELRNITLASKRKINTNKLKEGWKSDKEKEKYVQRHSSSVAKKMKKIESVAYQQFEKYQTERIALLEGELQQVNTKFDTAKKALDQKNHDFYKKHTEEAEKLYNGPEVTKQVQLLGKVRNHSSINKELPKASQKVTEAETQLQKKEDDFQKSIAKEAEDLELLYKAREKARKAYQAAQNRYNIYSRMQKLKQERAANQDVLENIPQKLNTLAGQMVSAKQASTRASKQMKKHGADTKTYQKVAERHEKATKKYNEALAQYRALIKKANKARKEMQAHEQEIWGFEHTHTADSATQINKDLASAQATHQGLTTRYQELSKNTANQKKSKKYYQELLQARWKMQQQMHKIKLLKERQKSLERLKGLKKDLAISRQEIQGRETVRIEYITQHSAKEAQANIQGMRLEALKKMENAKKTALDTSGNTEKTLLKLKSHSKKRVQLDKTLAQRYRKAMLLEQSAMGTTKAYLWAYQQTWDVLKAIKNTWRQRFKNEFKGNLQATKTLWKIAKVMRGVLNKLWKKEDYSLYAYLEQDMDKTLKIWKKHATEVPANVTLKYAKKLVETLPKDTLQERKALLDLLMTLTAYEEVIGNLQKAFIENGVR